METAGHTVRVSVWLGELQPTNSKDIQTLMYGLKYNAIRVGGIGNWVRVSIQLYGIVFRTTFFAHITIYNTSNTENTAPPYIYIKKIHEDFPFRVFWKRESDGLALYFQNTVTNLTADTEVANVAGNRVVERVMFTNDGTYTEISL